MASWTLIALSIIWAVTFFIGIAAACGTKFDTNFLSLGTLKTECADTFAILICLAVFDVVVDLGILITPMPFVSLALSTDIHALMRCSDLVAADASQEKNCGYRHASYWSPVSIAVGLATILIVLSAIACGITRMALFAQILGPAGMSSACHINLSFPNLIAIVLSVTSVGGDSSDDLTGSSSTIRI